MNDEPMLDIDSKKYPLAELTDKQTAYSEHIDDVEDKLRLNEFQHEQLLFTRTAYINALKASLEAHDANTE